MKLTYPRPVRMMCVKWAAYYYSNYICMFYMFRFVCVHFLFLRCILKNMVLVTSIKLKWIRCQQKDIHCLKVEQTTNHEQKYIYKKHIRSLDMIWYACMYIYLQHILYIHISILKRTQLLELWNRFNLYFYRCPSFSNVFVAAMSDEALQPVVKQLRKMSTHAPPGGGAPGGWWLKRNWTRYLLMDSEIRQTKTNWGWQFMYFYSTIYIYLQ